MVFNKGISVKVNTVILSIFFICPRKFLSEVLESCGFAKIDDTLVGFYNSYLHYRRPK